MKKLVVLVLSGVLVLPLSADSGPWAGYVTYAPQPIAASVVVKDPDLTWLADAARKLPTDGTVVLGRRDSDHWMALTNRSTSWLLQVHDETMKFNFRASILPKTGKITVEKGVDWAGTDQKSDVDRAASLALGYLARGRTGQDLFAGTVEAAPPLQASPPPAMVPASTAMENAKPEPMASPALGNDGAAVWQKLMEGNSRFVSGKVLHPHQSMARLDETAQTQQPFVIVVSCSDSRVAPEVLFDQGIGDLFVIRTAGEVVTEVELGSIEYAVEHLGVGSLIVVGHKRCGAVDATLKGGDLPPNIEAVAAQIRPAVEAARFMKGDLLDNAVRENAQVVLRKIQNTPALSEAFHAGRLSLKAAYYDLDSGKVAALP